MTKIADITEVLPEEDCQFLHDSYPNHDVRPVGAEIHVLIKDFDFPPAYTPQVADLLLRLPASYPSAAPDMFWTRPDVKLRTGAWPEGCAHHEVPGSGPGSEVYGGIVWQRWSRHFGDGGWIVGVHGLQFFLASIVQDLKRGI